MNIWQLWLFQNAADINLFTYGRFLLSCITPDPLFIFFQAFARNICGSKESYNEYEMFITRWLWCIKFTIYRDWSHDLAWLQWINSFSLLNMVGIEYHRAQFINNIILLPVEKKEILMGPILSEEAQGRKPANILIILQGVPGQGSMISKPKPCDHTSKASLRQLGV